MLRAGTINVSRRYGHVARCDRIFRPSASPQREKTSGTRVIREDKKRAVILRERSTSTPSETQTKHLEHVNGFVYSIVKVTRLYDRLSNMADDLFSIFNVFFQRFFCPQRFVGISFLDCVCRMLIGWGGNYTKLHFSLPFMKAG